MESQVFRTYEHFCEYCGQPLSTFHHFIPKSRSTLLRYDIKNGIALCQKCHYKIHFSSKPSEVYEIVKAIRESRGKEWVKYIEGRERETISKTIKWLEEQKKNLLVDKLLDNILYICILIDRREEIINNCG